MTKPSEAPAPPQRPISRTLHGETVVDPYAWMRERESEEVLAHLRGENAYTEASLAHLAAFREQLFQEIKSRVQETDLSVPARKGPFWYLTRTEEGEQYAVSCRRRGSADGPGSAPNAASRPRFLTLLRPKAYKAAFSGKDLAVSVATR